MILDYQATRLAADIGQEWSAWVSKLAAQAAARRLPTALMAFAVSALFVGAAVLPAQFVPSATATTALIA